MYVRDIAKMLILLGTKKCEDGVYNFASKDNRMLRDYIIELKEILTSESKVNFGVISYGSEGVISFEPVIDKFVNNFPNIKFTSFAAGINAMKKQA